MAVSTGSILHFTKNINFLKEILAGSFSLHYCKEFFKLDNAEYRLGIPMVSFCDIPLSQILDHVQKYGNYGIGLSKEWAKSKGINPVFYMEQYSLSAQLIEPFLRNVIEKDEFGNFRAKFIAENQPNNLVTIKPIDNQERTLKINALIGQLSFMKNYEGLLTRNGKSRKYKYYAEREWRYVPSNDDHSETDLYFHPILTETEYTDWRGISKRKPAIKHRFLRFLPKDVSYVFVSKESEISPLIKYLKKQKNITFNTDEELDLLISRIFSIERIKSDV
jgi:Putative abortive phage resistance protein AbiGi, antitoxin